MKVCKYIIGAVTVVLSVALVIIFFMAKNDPSSALAVAAYYPEDVTKVDYTVTIAWAIAVACTAIGGILSIVFAASRKFEGLMCIFYAIGFLLALMYSLLYPCLLWLAVADFIALMFSVSYSQIEHDFNGSL